MTATPLLSHRSGLNGGASFDVLPSNDNTADVTHGDDKDSDNNGNIDIDSNNVHNDNREDVDDHDQEGEILMTEEEASIPRDKAGDDSDLTAAFTGPFRLMDLFPEVRRLVWRELKAIGFERNDYKGDFGTPGEYTPEDYEKPVNTIRCSWTLHALLLTCRQTYQETLALQYKKLDFCFSATVDQRSSPAFDMIKDLPWTLIGSLDVRLATADDMATHYIRMMKMIEWGNSLTRLRVDYDFADLDGDPFPDGWTGCTCEGCLEDNILQPRHESLIEAIGMVEARCWVSYTFESDSVPMWTDAEKQRLQNIGLSKLVPAKYRDETGDHDNATLEEY
ncbi:Hypothetical protein D9617_27g045330 [Elsinoe fawcettii]|nr:Hypothetical protein D9617_27g045330 [Elsinoe fawcettii]